jgi:4-hydroxy-3-methylbut-2-enyl diphosphate reductase
VSKVHRQAERLIADGRHIIFIGHAGHPEVIGHSRAGPPGSMTLVETVEDVAASLRPAGQSGVPHADHLVGRRHGDDRRGAASTLSGHPRPRSEDICYATSNRQAAVKAIAGECERMLVIGAPTSSNSLRLAEVAERMGVPSRLIERAADIDWGWVGQPATIGITAGASAPELLVREVVDAFRERFEVEEHVADHTPERMVFKLPRELVA